jgi:hypothetical protein
MTYSARLLPVLAAAPAAVITAQSEAGEEIAYGRQSISPTVDTFIATAQKAIASQAS